MSVDVLRIIVEGEDRASGVLGKVGGALGSFGKIAGGVAVAGAAALAVGGAALAGVLADCVGEAIGAEEATAQLNAVLRSTGGAAGVTADMANDLASSLSSITRFGDEAILSGESMLLTFTNIGKDVFPATTEVMLDMSQALGQDLKSSAMQLGKALNDPVSGITALTRVGVTFTDSQKAMIEKMVESGDVAGAQKVILAELQKEFGGSARAAGETFAGQLDILNNALGNVKEGVGMALLPVLTGLAHTLGPILLTAAQGFADFLTSTVVPAISRVGTTISQLLMIFQQWHEHTGTLTGGLNGVIGAVGLMFPQLAPLVAGIKLVSSVFGDDLQPILATVTSLVSGISRVFMDTVSTGGSLGLALENAAYSLQQMVPALYPITQAIQGFALQMQVTEIKASGLISRLIAGWPEVASALIEGTQDVVAMWQPAWEQIRSMVEDTLSLVSEIILRVLGIIVGSVQDHASNLQALFENAWFRVRDIITGVVDGVRQIVVAILSQLAGFLESHGTEIKQTLGNAWEQIGRIINLALDVIRATVVPLLQGIAQFIREHSSEIQTLLTNAWTIIKTVITTVLGVIEGLLKAVMAAIKGDWKGAWEEVKKVAETLWEGIKTIIITALNTLLSVVGTSLDTIKQWFIDRFNEIVGFLRGIDLGEIGRNLIEGLVNGVKAKAQALIDAVTGVVSGAIEWAKRLLGERSPSRVFHQIGVFAMQGFANGIEESQPITIDAISEHIQVIVAELARLANDVVAPAAVHSAKAFSDAVAPIFENVRDIVQGIVALAGLEGVNLPQNVPGLMRQLAVFVEHLTRALTDVASRIPDLGAAAMGLAENVGPVFGIVADAVGAFGALNDADAMQDIYVGWDTTAVEVNMWKLAHFARDLAKIMGQVSLAVSGELQAAAKQLAENVGPVVGIVEDAVGAFKMLSDPTAMQDVYVGWDITAVEMNMWKLAHFARDLAKIMGQVSLAVGTELQAAAKGLAESVAPVIGIVKDGIEAFTGLATMDTTVLPAAQAAVTTLSTFLGNVFTQLGTLRPVADAEYLAETGTSLFAILREAIEGMASLAKLDTRDMRAWALEAGLGWITGLADGIRSGMGYLQEALSGVSTALASSLTPAMATVATGLNGAGAPRGGTTVNNYVTINNPVIRDEADIAALADAVSERLGARADTYARFGY